MSDARPRSRWLFLLSPRWLTWHAFTFVCAVGMFLLGAWQLHRAETGNALSWGYTFEWPVFALFVVVFWGKTIFDEGRHPGCRAAKQAEVQQADDLSPAGLRPDDDPPLPDTGLPGTGLPAGAHIAAETDDDAADDPELAAYNAYLSRLNTQATPRGRTAQHSDTTEHSQTKQHGQTAPQIQITREEAGSAP